MYERDISRRDPGCVVFLLDRSDSMKSTWVNSQETLRSEEHTSELQSP